jgi:hypothetical protein
MAAGLGFKDFVTGEVLTAADVDGYLMQGIWVFADATARDAAVTSPQEGNACYLKDTNEVLTYSGSTWVAVGGGSPLTTKGDLFTFSTTDARLAVGANGTTLVADSSTSTGLKWDTPAAGGMTLISTTTLSGATTTLSSIPQTYNSLYLVVTGVTYNTSNKGFRLSPNDVTNLSNWLGLRTTEIASGTDQTMYLSTGQDTLRTDADNIWTIQIDNYTSATRYKTFNWVGSFLSSTPTRIVNSIGGVFKSNTAITSLVFDVERTNTFATGTVLLYGVK